MRDTLKTKAYFDDYIEFNQASNDRARSKLEQGGVIPESNTLAHCQIRNRSYKILVSNFSRGEDVASLIPYFNVWLDDFIGFHNARMKEEPCSRLQWVNLGWDNYEEYMWLLSWAVLLHRDNATLSKIESMIDCRDPGAFCRRGAANYVVGNNRGKDQLLDLLLNKAGLVGPQSDALEIGGIYKKLLQVCLDAPEKRASQMAKYIDGWHAGNKQRPWYNSARDDDSGYIGFWSFEAALVARLFDIDDEEFADHPHYPKDLARFQG